MFNEKIFFIAEAGVNHNGNLDLAKKLVEIAKESGADCIKFQTFKAEELVSRVAKKAEYQSKNTNNYTETQFEMLKKLELSNEDFIELHKYCKKVGIIFASTPFSFNAFKFLYSLNLDFIKISSGDLTNYPLLFNIAKTGTRMIISTGMGNMKEIQNAVGVISAGYLNLDKPDITKLKEYTLKANEILNQKLSVLHCTTNYPASIENINLNSIAFLKDKLDLKNVGYSDHTTSLEVPMYASFAGATIIEKHFTISKTMEGPDHIASLEMQELKKAIENVRFASKLLGNCEKKMNEEEAQNLHIARKSIYAKNEILEGESFTSENLILKRPFIEKDPLNYWNILGQKAKKHYSREDPIDI